MAIERKIIEARKTGAFVQNIDYKLTRLSKSKLNVFLSCPRRFWYSEVLQRPERHPVTSEVAMVTGKLVHALQEKYYRYAFEKRLRLEVEGSFFIDSYFDQISLGDVSDQLRAYTNNFREWEHKRLTSYHELRGELPKGFFRYYLPAVLLSQEPAVEFKLYDESLDRVGIIDQMFWLPVKERSGSYSEHLMLVETKTGRHNPSLYTKFRVELTFLQKLCARSDIVPETPTYGAVYWVDSNDVILFKFSERNVQALNRRIEELKKSISNDYYPRTPGDDPRWSPCLYCPHSGVCSMQNDKREYRFEPLLDD